MKKTLGLFMIAGLLALTFGSTVVSAHNGEDNDSGRDGSRTSFLGFKSFFGGEVRSDDSLKDKKEVKDDDNDGDNHRNGDKSFAGLVNRSGFRGVAKVTSVSGNTIVAKKAIGSSGNSWTIETDSDTDFMLRTGKDATIKDISVGDLISFKGTVLKVNEGDPAVKNDSSITLDATNVRIWGDVDLEAKAKVTGTVQSVNDDNDQLVIETSDNEKVTVNASDLSIIKNEDGSKGTFSNIDVGMTVKIKGWWNSFKNAITAFKIKIS